MSPLFQCSDFRNLHPAPSRSRRTSTLDIADLKIGTSHAGPDGTSIFVCGPGCMRCGRPSAITAAAGSR